jgi:membrane peptidoglycan carboxypeptidase
VPEAHPLTKLIGCCVLAGVLLAGLLFPTVGGIGLLSNKASDTVDSVSTELAQGQVPQMTTMLDSAGNPIAYLYDPNGRRTVVPADKISDAMKLAIVSIEDRRFYEHQGVDWRGTFRAFLTNTSSGETQQGASTLTQQYVKNYLLLVVAQNDAERQAATETTPARKLKEIRIALALDKELGKQEILTRYLNIVPFGSGAYGIQAAAQTYFGVNAADLNVPQSAMLAGMVQSSSVTPYSNPEAVLARRNLVLDTMQTNGVLNAADTATAKATPLGVLPRPARLANGCVGASSAQSTGFFCSYVIKYLADAGISPDQVNKGGYTIKTTLNPAVQASAKAATNKYAPADLKNIASVMDVVQPGQTAHKVLAMADSRTYGYDAGAKETSLLQTASLESDGAGSIFKVFTTAAAMEQGLGTNAVLDTPQTVRISGFGTGGCGGGSPDYCVKNYNGNYKPNYTVTQALSQSPNTAFVKLIASTGVTPTVDMAVRLGLRSYATQPAGDGTPRTIAQKYKEDNSASFTLGPEAVDPVELSNVAATLSSGGMWCPPTPIESVTDAAGKPVNISAPACEQVVPPGLANTLANALNQDPISGTAAGAAKTVNWNLPMSSKTGTTDNEFSSAFLGFTNTLAGANLVFDDSNERSGICTTPLRSCSSPNLTGGAEPARTWFAAISPIIGGFGPVVMPPTDPKYVNGSGKGNVPDLRGISASDATKQLSELGFKVTQTSQANGSSRGTVVAQSVTGPTAPGSTVTLYVSTGQAPPGPAPGAQQTIQVPVPGVPPIVLPPGVVVPGIPPP